MALYEIAFIYLIKSTQQNNNYVIVECLETTFACALNFFVDFVIPAYIVKIELQNGFFNSNEFNFKEFY